MSDLEAHRLGCGGKHMVNISLRILFKIIVQKIDSLEVSTLTHLVEYEGGLLHLATKTCICCKEMSISAIFMYIQEHVQ